MSTTMLRVGVLTWILRPLLLAAWGTALFTGQDAAAQVGACCVGTTCSLRTLNACDSALGEWFGLGSSCSPNPCVSAPGTCCNGTNCTIRTDAACASAGGTFVGGTTCSPNPCSGSCCVTGNCSLTSVSSCTASGGIWLRFGACSPNICPGPCCRNGQCTITVQSLCTAGGAWTPGATCFPNSCPAPQCALDFTANTGGDTTAVARVGTTTGLLVAHGRTLEMFNAVNTNAPVPFSPPRRVLMPDVAVKIAYSAATSRAFVLLADGDVFYATIVTTPQLLIGDTHIIGGTLTPDIEVDGDRVFMPRSLGTQSSTDSDVFIYVRGVDGSPALLGQFQPLLQNFIIDRVAKVGNTLWLGMHQSTTYVVQGWDVSNPAAPSPRGSIGGFADLSGETRITGMQAIGTKLLISFHNQNIGPGSGDNLRAADVSNPASPFWHPEFVMNVGVRCMSANGTQLRVGAGSVTQTWETANPASLTLLGSFDGSPASPMQIAAGATTDYLAVGHYGLQTISFASPASPVVRSLRTDPLAYASLVGQTGVNTVVFDPEINALKVFDYTLSEAQQLRGSVSVPSGYYYLMDLTLTSGGSQKLACLGDIVDGRIVIVDVTSPTAPVVRSTIIGSGVWRMSVSGARLYVLSSAPELKIYDLSNAAAPVLLSTTPYGGSRFNYTCMESWQNGSAQAVALGTAGFGLWLIDATNAATPLVSSVHMPVPNYTVEAVTRGSSFLYVSSSETSSDSRLESLVVTDLAHPTVHYATGPGIGADEPGTFESLSFVNGPSGRFLIGVFPSGSGLVLMDLAGPLGEGVMYPIFTLPVGSISGVAPSLSNTNVMLAVADGGLLQVPMPPTWAPGFSSPAYETRNTCLGGSVVIEVQASASPATITYQWFRLGNPAVALTNGSLPGNSTIAGATGPTLTISNIHARDNLAYFYCEATNACGTTRTKAVNLHLCIADFNCSGAVTVQDIFDFLAAYFAGNSLADINGAGGLSVQDIFDFLAAYFAGCP